MKNSAPPTPTGQIIFKQYWLPHLPPGTYTIEISQAVTASGDKPVSDHFGDSKTFVVRGERFSLNPTEVRAVFPPENHLGEFDNVLPHVVLSRATLPWERDLDPASPNSGASDCGDVAPWLALLLLDEDDAPFPQPTLATVQNLKTPPSGTLFPQFELQYAESMTDPCTIIDVSVGLFSAIAPTADDLKRLAHVRYVSAESAARKAANDIALPTPQTTAGNFAVLMGNRLPRKGKTSTVHLVNLEGFGPYLPDDNGKTSPKLADYAQVRLVSLASWSFTAVDEKQTFAGLLEHLNGRTGTPPDPLATLRLPGDGSDAAANAIKMGYVALEHHTRWGDDTVSWYRGPLTPCLVQRRVKTPITCSDAAVYYDPETGMFDVSYAAAWQLGRLLALQSEHLAMAVYNWRQENIRQAIASMEAPAIAALGGPGDAQEARLAVAGYVKTLLGVYVGAGQEDK